MDTKIFWELNEAYQLGVCNQEVVEEETLTEEELEGIQEWVEALIEEGYDLDQFSDEELYEAYLEDLDEAKVDSGLSRVEKRVARRGRLASEVNSGRREPLNTDELEQGRQWRHLQSRGMKKPEAKSRPTGSGKYGAMQRRKGMSEELDFYDIVSDYLVSEGFCDTLEDASVIMANMSGEWRDSIMEEVLDEAKKYESHVLKGVPETLHGTVKKAVRSQTKQKSEPTTRQKVLGHKLSSLRDRNYESDEPVRGSKRGAESPTDR